MTRPMPIVDIAPVDGAHQHPGEKPTLVHRHVRALPGGSHWSCTAIGVQVLFLLGLMVTHLPAQSGRSAATRAELETLVNAENAGTIKVDRKELAEIQRRLTQGDFAVGDQVALTVAGEPTLTATFSIEPGPSITLPDIPTISLYGVLRSELETFLTTELSRYLRNPDVKATSLIRVAMFGGIGNPGFYHLSPNLTLSDAIMSAGGPRTDADMGKIEIKRGDEKILDKKAVSAALTAGETLDRLNLHGGDAIDVGTKKTLGSHFLSGIIYLGAVATAIIAIQRLTGKR